MKIDINEVIAIQKRRQEINSLPFLEIEWYDGDKKLDIAQKVKEDYRFTALNNMDFITLGCYLESEIFKDIE